MHLVDTVLLQRRGTSSRAVVVVGRGCACASSVLESPQGPRDVLWAPDDYLSPAGRPSAGGIPILCPYPGRLASTSMAFRGRSFTLPPGDPLGRPIHGLVHDRAWRVLERDDERVVARFRLSADAPEALRHWPADFTVTATWTLGSDRLDLTLELLAHGPMPAALGLHPYHPLPVVPGGAAEQCAIEVPATLWQPQERLLPVGPTAPSGTRPGVTFPGRTLLDGLVLDDPFTGFEASPSGRVVARVVDGADGAAIRAAWDPVYASCVLFTPPHGRAVCIEPSTVLPGQREFTAAAGWRELGDGERLAASYSVSAE